jgi:hypothetical protein
MRKWLLLMVAALALTGCAWGPLWDEARVRGVVPDVSNYWYQPDRTIHIVPGQPVRVLLHEACHGWQGRNLPPGDVPLRGWYYTPEGRDFQGTLEQAADVCASYYLGVPIAGPYITDVNPDWYRWQKEWLP